MVADVRPELGATAAPMLYAPFAQVPFHDVALLLETTGRPASLAAPVREAIWSANRALAIGPTATLDDRLAELHAGPRFLGVIAAIFAVQSVSFAAVGLYGIVAYTVLRRRRELGVRSALGAGRAALLRQTMAGGLTLGLVGCAAGLIAAWAVAHTFSNAFYGVEAFDPATYLGVALLLITVQLVACAVPARRAATVDPATVLSTDG